LSEHVLPFEKRLLELQRSLAHAHDDADRTRLAAELQEERERISTSLTAWDRVELARHPARPRMLDYTSRLFEQFVELHGDRKYGDDPAMVAGVAQYRGRTVFVVGQHKGQKTEERIRRKFGMAHPEGYRKAMRIAQLAERLGHPLLTFVDTPAAHPDLEAEERGQGPTIADSLRTLLGLKVPIFCAVLSEGGSGGALAIAVADRIAMLEHAIYLICPPERCAEILWRDAERRREAAESLRVTAKDLLGFGVIDAIVEEGPLGAHRDPEPALAGLRAEIDRFLEGVEAGEYSPASRQQKFRRMGTWIESAPEASD